MLRELSTTNSVASPTKFAEYLFAGLPVLISDNLGDFTSVVKNSKVGMVYVQNTNELLNILKPSKETKNMCRDLARTNFLKSSDSVSASYLNMCNFLLT